MHHLWTPVRTKPPKTAYNTYRTPMHFSKNLGMLMEHVSIINSTVFISLLLKQWGGAPCWVVVSKHFWLFSTIKETIAHWTVPSRLEKEVTFITCTSGYCFTVPNWANDIQKVSLRAQKKIKKNKRKKKSPNRCTWITFQTETDKEVAASKMPPRTQCSGVEEKISCCCLDWRRYEEETEVLSITGPL